MSPYVAACRRMSPLVAGCLSHLCADFCKNQEFSRLTLSFRWCFCMLQHHVLRRRFRKVRKSGLRCVNFCVDFFSRRSYFEQLFRLLRCTSGRVWLRGPSKNQVPVDVFALFSKITRFESQNFEILTTFDAGFKSCFV